MKIKFFISIVFFAISLSAMTQPYEITSAYPENLVPGDTNVIELILNQELEPGDSILYAGAWVYFNGGFIDTMIHSYYILNIDTIVYAHIVMPDKEFDDTGILYLQFKNYADSIGYFPPVTIGKEFSSITPEICIVSVDSLNRNTIVWENPQAKTIDSVFIYKETSVMNEYEKIGAKSFEDQSVYSDAESITAQSASRYRISYIDTAQNESITSKPHKTIHLTMNEGLNRTVNLIWDDYEGFYYSTFDIYRGSSKKGMMKIAEIAGNLFSFTDLTPPHGKLYYQVVIEKPEPCIITKSKSTVNDYSSTKSNIVELSISSLNKNRYSNLIEIYPNPVKDRFYIQFSDQQLSEVPKISIFDMMGRQIQDLTASDTESGVDVSSLRKGVYLIKIISDTEIYSSTFVKQ